MSEQGRRREGTILVDRSPELQQPSDKYQNMRCTLRLGGQAKAKGVHFKYWGVPTPNVVKLGPFPSNITLEARKWEMEAVGRHVDEWYEEGVRKASGTREKHQLLLLKAILSSVDLKKGSQGKGSTPLHVLAERLAGEGQDDTIALDGRGTLGKQGRQVRESVHLLKNCGVDLDSKRKSDGATALALAAGKGCRDLVESLVEAGADVNLESKHHGAMLTPLACAARTGGFGIVRYLLKHDARWRGSEALHHAAASGSYGSVKRLIKDGADPSEVAKDGRTPAQWCFPLWREEKTERGLERAKALSCLLKNGADVHIREENDESVYTLLHSAAGLGDHACIPVLIKAGLEVDVRDNNHFTPLHWASFAGRVGSVKELIANNACLDVADARGLTPLMFVVMKGREEVAVELIRGGASVLAKADASVTALHLAAALGDIKMAYLLVEAGADMDALSDAGQSPLAVCVCPDEDREPVLALLFFHIRKTGGMEERTKVATFLLKVGASVSEEVIRAAVKSGMGHVFANVFNKGREELHAVSERFCAAADHYSMIEAGEEARPPVTVRVWLVNKRDLEGEVRRGRKQYLLSLPLVEQLMAKVAERRSGTARSQAGCPGVAADAAIKVGSDSRRSAVAAAAPSSTGILANMLHPALFGFKGDALSQQGGERLGQREVELECDGDDYTEEGFEAVVRFVTTGSVEQLLTGRMEGGKAGEGRNRLLFDAERAVRALQAADFFSLEGMAREIEALMGEYGFELQEEPEA